MKKELIIIGAGLSGLYSAYLLQDRYKITIIEGRERIGGRILTIDSHDMGPSWVWGHQKNILSLLSTLGLELFAQYTEGYARYETQEDVESFTPPPPIPSARLKGGMAALVEAIAAKLKDEVTIHLGQEVKALHEDDFGISVVSRVQTYRCDIVLNTMPPRLAAALTYIPMLPREKLRILEETPTWMGGATKVVILYPRAFWREASLSGFAFSHKGPLGEIHDACTSEHAALFGFLSSAYSGNDLERDVIAQLVHIFGTQAKRYTQILIRRWGDEPFTSSRSDREALRIHPEYGYSIAHFDGKVKFISTESAYDNGGYLEGAIVSALEACRSL